MIELHTYVFEQYMYRYKRFGTSRTVSNGVVLGVCVCVSTLAILMLYIYYYILTKVNLAIV